MVDKAVLERFKAEGIIIPMITLSDVISNNVLKKGYGDKTFVYFEDERISHREFYEKSLLYAHLFLKKRRFQDRPFNVGVLMDNYPEFIYCFGGCAFAGAGLVGLNTVQKGSMLARDINFTDCQVLVTETKYLQEVMGIKGQLETISENEILVNNYRDESRDLPANISSLEDSLLNLERELGQTAKQPPGAQVTPDHLQMIIFTSGSTGAPKGIINSHLNLIIRGFMVAARLQLTPSDVCYGVMPMFHSNTTLLAVVPALISGGAIATRRKFSASGFIKDVKNFGVTTFNYVGKPLAFILSTTAQPDDSVNSLRVALGNGATYEQQLEFQRRFGLDEVVEGFGSTEGGASTMRAIGDPPGTVGAALDELKIIGETGQECEPACIDENGRFLNYSKAVGEIINTGGIGTFEGYYKNTEATAAKTRNHMFHTGDMGFIRILEKDGQKIRYLYFVGRTDDWIRKDGENFLADPIEDIIGRHPAVFLSSVYGVPCDQGDELVMVSLTLREGVAFDPKGFYQFCLQQKDMSTKWIPDYVRLMKTLPQTDTNKVLRRHLKQDFFDLNKVKDPIFWRERDDDSYKLFGPGDFELLKEKFQRVGRGMDLIRS